MNTPLAYPALVREPAMRRQEYLGSIALDQWRGLALVLVLISHGFFHSGRVHGIGRVGVNLFFFISGILVFRSLSRTRAPTAWGSTKSFWWRRLRRLYPALITYVFALLPIVWWAQGLPHLPAASDIGSYLKGIPTVLVYGANYHPPEFPTALGHLWSLACEMQFYLLAPVVYFLGGETKRRRDLLFGLLLSALMALGAMHPIIRRWYPLMDDWKYHFEFAVWPMMLGFCCEYRREWFKRMPVPLATLSLYAGATICCLSMAIMLVGLELKPLVVATGALLLAPCLVAYLFGRPIPGIMGSSLRWMGERTYSIYLWQQPLTICGFVPTVLRPLGAVASVGVGGIWFHLFERPFLSASRRIDTVAKLREFHRRKVVGLGFLILVMTVLLAGWTLRAQYEERLRGQIWPLAAPLAIVQAGPEGPQHTVMLLGDSRMEQWGLPSLPHWRLVNAGAAGLTTGQIRLRAQALLDEFHPDAVVLQAGINDLKFLGLRPGLLRPLVALAASNLTAIVAECSARHCKVLVLETWPPGRPSILRLPVWSAAIPASVDELNWRLREMTAPSRGIWVVDLLERAGLTASPDLYRDTLHFEREVYQRLTPALEIELDTIERH